MIQIDLRICFTWVGLLQPPTIEKNLPQLPCHAFLKKALKVIKTSFGHPKKPMKNDGFKALANMFFLPPKIRETWLPMAAWHSLLSRFGYEAAKLSCLIHYLSYLQLKLTHISIKDLNSHGLSECAKMLYRGFSKSPKSSTLIIGRSIRKEYPWFWSQEISHDWGNDKANLWLSNGGNSWPS